MPQLSVAFYTEAGSKRGMGHLMRCYSIYEYFKDKNHKVHFFLDSDINYDDKLQDISYFEWDNFYMDQSYDVVFIDSYLADIQIYKMISTQAKVPVFIDDYARLDYPGGIVLNFAPEAEHYFKEKKPYHKYLLGLKYLPFRKQLLSIEVPKRKQIFISLGGSDIKNYSYDIIYALQHVGVPLVITINDYEVAKKIALCKNTHILFKPTEEELIVSMKESIMAISTASMTLYELAYLKIPTIIIAVSENQTLGASQLLKYNLACMLLDMEDKCWEKNLLNNVNKLLDGTFQVNRNSIDDKGNERIYKEIKRLLPL